MMSLPPFSLCMAEASASSRWRPGPPRRQRDLGKALGPLNTRGDEKVSKNPAWTCCDAWGERTGVTFSALTVLMAQGRSAQRSSVSCPLAGTARVSPSQRASRMPSGSPVESGGERPWFLRAAQLDRGYLERLFNPDPIGERCCGGRRGSTRAVAAVSLRQSLAKNAGSARMKPPDGRTRPTP